MWQIRILRRVMRRSGASRIWAGFLVFFFLCALLIWLRDPAVRTLWDGIWYCYEVVTTIGFGDITVKSVLARVLSILLSVYAVLVIAIVTGVVVNYFNQLVELRQKGSLTALIDKLERLLELPPEELEQVSRQVREYRGEIKGRALR